MAEVKEKKAPEEKPATTKKSGKGLLFWLALVGCGCLILVGCALGGITLMCVTSDEFQEEFEKSYCDSLEEEGIEPEEDPFGICD